MTTQNDGCPKCGSLEIDCSFSRDVYYPHNDYNCLTCKHHWTDL